MGERPGISRIETLGQRCERTLDPRKIGELLRRHPRRLIADIDTVDEAPAHLAGVGDVTRHGRQPELGDEFAVGGVAVADDLAAGLHGTAIGQCHRLNTAAGTVACLEHDRIGAPAHEISRCAQPAQSGTQHSDIEHDGLLAYSGGLSSLKCTALDTDDRAAVVC